MSGETIAALIGVGLSAIFSTAALVFSWHSHRVQTRMAASGPWASVLASMLRDVLEAHVVYHNMVTDLINAPCRDMEEKSKRLMEMNVQGAKVSRLISTMVDVQPSMSEALDAWTSLVALKASDSFFDEGGGLCLGADRQQIVEGEYSDKRRRFLAAVRAASTALH